MDHRASETLNYPDAADDILEFDDAPTESNESAEAGDLRDGEAPAEDDESTGDATALFYADLATTAPLSREEEASLVAEIATHRNDLRGLVDVQRGLLERLLPGCDLEAAAQDFSEREVVCLVTQARRALRRIRSTCHRRRLQRVLKVAEHSLDLYRAARDRMLRANLRLVTMVARRYQHPTLSFLDLVQEGTLGLLRAVEKFDPERGIKFSTYAMWWIWQQLARAADRQGAVVRTPVHWNQLRRKVARQQAERWDAAIDQVAAEHGLPADQVATMAQGFQFVSLATPVGQQDDREWEAILPGDAAGEPEERLGAAELAERLEAALAEVPEREAAILRMRFGMHSDCDQTLDAIGQQFGLSRERVRQLEARALKRLRLICVRDGLADCLV